MGQLTDAKIVTGFFLSQKRVEESGRMEKSCQRAGDAKNGCSPSGGMPQVKPKKAYTYDGLHIEELSWQLPYGRPTEAIVLKPENVQGRLPAIVAFHDHAGNKYFGTLKITRTPDQNPLMADHQKQYYSSLAWANEIARQGYVVLVADGFAFASCRIMLKDVPAPMRNKLTDPEPSNTKGIEQYNQWAGDHEHILSKSLFCLNPY